jgi:hypothetical protein
MTMLAWFLSEVAFPASLGAAFALAADVARHPLRVRHYRWKNKRFLRRQVPVIELRSRSCGRGGSGVGSPVIPQPVLPARVGGDARPPGPVDAVLPPTPHTLVGAADPRHAAPARPPSRVAVHG